ncbi:MAG: signal peptide peptidase SppA [Chloroflexi bacterium]|nr:signal peptide peptidase SppA [Chloroflexota bacterium]
MAFERWGEHIAVKEIFGVIRGGPPLQLHLELLERIRRSARVKAVVLDVDSPGGSAAASHHLRQAVAHLAEKKPVVAFIREMGASGGYLACVSATRIVAFPSSIVGSIGVLSLRPIVQELFQKWGIKIAVTKSGRLKDMGAFYREPTEEETTKLQALNDAFYDDFVSVVATSRRLEESRVREYATGEVFTAKQAQAMGLVDELGDFDRAIDLASNLGVVPRRYVYVRPKRDWRAKFISRFAAEMAEEVSAQVEERITRLYYGGWGVPRL